MYRKVPTWRRIQKGGWNWPGDLTRLPCVLRLIERWSLRAAARPGGSSGRPPSEWRIPNRRGSTSCPPWRGRCASWRRGGPPITSSRLRKEPKLLTIWQASPCRIFWFVFFFIYRHGSSRRGGGPILEPPSDPFGTALPSRCCSDVGNPLTNKSKLPSIISFIHWIHFHWNISKDS